MVLVEEVELTAVLEDVGGADVLEEAGGADVLEEAGGADVLEEASLLVHALPVTSKAANNMATASQATQLSFRGNITAPSDPGLSHPLQGNQA